MAEFRAVHVELLGGWIIQKKTPTNRYWFFPEEETTYGVLDSQTQTSYPSEEYALKRIEQLRAATRPTEPQGD